MLRCAQVVFCSRICTQREGPPSPARDAEVGCLSHLRLCLKRFPGQGRGVRNLSFSESYQILLAGVTIMFQGQTQNYIFNNKTVEHHKILSTAHRNGNKSQLPPNNYYVDCAGECESSTPIRQELSLGPPSLVLRNKRRRRKDRSCRRNSGSLAQWRRFEGADTSDEESR